MPAASDNIHPTALIDSAAQLGPKVEIGPYAVIGPQVVIGGGTKVQSHVILEGNVTIGERNLIGHGAAIGGTPQDLSVSTERAARVEIGDENIIREYCTIHRGTAEDSATTVGNQNYLMGGAHVGHNCSIGNKVIIANNCLLGGHVEVDDQAFLGGGCVFHQWIRVGRLAITQGGSRFSKDIPPFVIAAGLNLVFGLNAIGLQRAGISAEDRKDIKTAFKTIYMSGLNISQALEKAAGMNVAAVAREFFDFIGAAKRRGICSVKHRGTGESSA